MKFLPQRPSYSKYKLLGADYIAAGGFGVVYPGIKRKYLPWCGDDRPVYAIKVCPLPGGSKRPSIITPTPIENLKEEAEFMQSLAPSDYIITLVDAFRYNRNEFWMVMELMKTDLGTLAKTGILVPHPKTRKYVIWQVIQALKHLKQNKIVHHDIKRDNILVSPEGYVKLCDFGLAKRIENGVKLTVRGRGAGSPQYMAPELFVDGFEYDYAIDVWCFGWLIYSTFANVRKNKFRWEYDEVVDLTYYYACMLGEGYLLKDESEFIGGDWVFLTEKQRKQTYDEARDFYKDNVYWVDLIRSILVPPSMKRPSIEELGEKITLEGVSVEDMRKAIKSIC